MASNKKQYPPMTLLNKIQGYVLLIAMVFMIAFAFNVPAIDSPNHPNYKESE